MSTEITTTTPTETPVSPETPSRLRISPRWSSQKTEQAYEVEIELPGVQKSGVRLRQENHFLYLEADRDTTQDTSQLISGQCPPEGYRLKIKIPDEVDAKKLQGTLNNGRLSVVLPLSSDNLPREIPLN